MGFQIEGIIKQNQVVSVGAGPNFKNSVGGYESGFRGNDYYEYIMILEY